MRIRSTLSTFAVAAVAGSLLLSACGDSETEAAPSPNTDLTSSAVEPSDAESRDDEAPEEEDDGLPPQPSSTREPVSVGTLEDGELNDVGVAWFGAFCSGINGMSEFKAPNIEELSVEEAAQAVGTTYMQFGEGFSAVAAQLDGLDTSLNFDNGDAFAAEAVESIAEVGVVYSGGSEVVKDGTYATQDDLIADVRQVETEAVEAGAGDFGLSNLGETVFNAVTIQVPACGGTP